MTVASDSRAVLSDVLSQSRLTPITAEVVLLYYIMLDCLLIKFLLSVLAPSSAVHLYTRATISLLGNIREVY